jgi:hypothetical protein
MYITSEETYRHYAVNVIRGTSFPGPLCATQILQVKTDNRGNGLTISCLTHDSAWRTDINQTHTLVAIPFATVYFKYKEQSINVVQ